MRLAGTKLAANHQYRGFGDQLYDLSGQRPSLDLQFANQKSLVDATTGQNLVTFTRASSGTYVDSQGVIRTATTNEARFDHNPTTGESLGLLVEESRTNSLLNSEDFTAVSWGTVNGTVTANTVNSPAGTLTADSFTENSGANDPRMPVVFAFAAGTNYTLSVYAKVLPGSAQRYLMLVYNSGYATQPGANFDLVTGTVGTTNSAIGSIQALPNGWYRCSMTPTGNATGSGSFRIRIAAVNTTGNITGPVGYTGDGTSGFYLWGAQLEAGSFPTSYIPTTAATATRSADVASITGSNFSSWFTSPGENTFYAEYQRPPGTGQILEGYDGGNIVGMSLSLAPTAPRTTARHGPSRCDTNVSGLPPYIAGTNKHVGATSASGSAAAANGTVLTTGTPVQNDWTATSSLAIGYRGAYGTERCNTSIKRLTYWPQRLPNETLQRITQ